MTNEERKAAIRKRLNIARNSKRENIVFSEANDHNPIVLESCPACRGHGKVCFEGDGYAELDTCSACDGLGTTGNLVRRFRNDSAPLAARVNDFGAVCCPHCGVGFRIHSRDSWTGLRHMSCGQKIILIHDDAELSHAPEPRNGSCWVPRVGCAAG
jgi:hypothetical protein